MTARSDILLVGEGHGCVAALTGLRGRFQRMDLVTEDAEITGNLKNGEHIVAHTDASDAPLVILAGSKTILDAATIARRPVFNIHYSLLPRYRGLHSVVWAILNDESHIGLTVHQVDEQIDHGDILYQHKIPLNDDLTSKDIMKRFDAHIAKNLGAIMRDYWNGNIPLRPQNHDEATWVPRRNLDDCLIDFDQKIRFQSLFFRALVEPYPRPSIICRGSRYAIAEHTLLMRPYRATNGRVVNISDEGAFIKIADGLLVAKTLVDHAGREVAAADILRMGERLS